MTMRKIGCIRLRSRVSDDLGQLLSDAGLEIKARSYLQEIFLCILVLFSEAFLYTVVVVQSKTSLKGMEMYLFCSTQATCLFKQNEQGATFS